MRVCVRFYTLFFYFWLLHPSTSLMSLWNTFKQILSFFSRSHFSYNNWNFSSYGNARYIYKHCRLCTVSIECKSNHMFIAWKIHVHHEWTPRAIETYGFCARVFVYALMYWYYIVMLAGAVAHWSLYHIINDGTLKNVNEKQRKNDR